MKKKVLLINLPYPLKYLAADAREDYRGGHLGLGYLASTLEQSGVEVELVDCPRLNIDIASLMEIIKQTEASAIGIHFYHINVHVLYRVLFVIGQLKTKPLVMLGGRQATATAKSLLESNKNKWLSLSVSSKNCPDYSTVQGL